MSANGRARVRIALLVLAVLAAAAVSTAAARAAGPLMYPGDDQLDRPAHTRVWPIRYRAHNGRVRAAYVLLPRWYGPKHDPPIPLVISPHGRGNDGLRNSKLWGDLPAIGSFAVVNPDGEGNHLEAASWGAPGQIEDLAKMPAATHSALPWLRIDERSIYAVGASMGGQETLLLLAKHPRLLAGAAVFDAVADFAHQYEGFARLGGSLQQLASSEVGGDPGQRPAAYAARSPLSYARQLAAACVPLQLWWSSEDRIVSDPEQQSARLLARVRELNPAAPVDGFEGTWAHSAEMHASRRLPYALAQLGLMPPGFDGAWGVEGTRLLPAPQPSCSAA